MIDTIKRFTVGRLLVIGIGVVAGLAVLTYVVYGATNAGDQPTLSEDERLVAVIRGDFLKQVAISGSLAFPKSESLFFSTAGTVGEVLVREGEFVTEGQVLATLDGVAVVTLRKQLAQAQRDLKEAQAALEEALKTNEQEQAAYRQVFRKWLGIELTDEQLTQDPATLLASWGIDLDVLFDPQQRFSDLEVWWRPEGPPPDDPSTIWNETILYTWLNLMPGQIMGTCPPDMPLGGEEISTGGGTIITPKVQCVQREMDDAWDVLGGSKSDPMELETLQANVVLAQAAAEEAQKKLDGASLVAPFDGIVTSLSIEAGQPAQSGNAAVRIIDPSVIELVGVLDQTDVLYVTAGSTALVTLDALPGQVLAGVISSVAASPNDQQGFIGYPVRIQVSAPEGMVFPEGLTGTARIVLSHQPDVLMVPVNAVRGTFDRPVVRVLERGRIVEREVTLGDSDDFWAVVLAGLEEGDEVVTSGQAPGGGGGFPIGPGIPRPLPIDGGGRPLPAPGGGAGPGIIIIEGGAGSRPIAVD